MRLIPQHFYEKTSIFKILLPVSKPILGVVMQKTMDNLMEIVELSYCGNVGRNLFLFHFNKPSDRNRVLRSGPWFLDKFVLVLEKPVTMV